jgi:hypothetical protein
MQLTEGFLPDGVSGARTTRAKWTDWKPKDCRAFGVVPLVAKHRLHESPLFSEAALLTLIDNYPKDRIQVFTMGTDVTKCEEWKAVAVGNLSAREIWQAIGRGRLWLKLLHLKVVDHRYRDAIDEIYAELAGQCPGFVPARTYGTLLISSPTALVYYHADPQPNLLWHLRGRKRVWVYPSGDRELISQQLMEDIFASYVDEEAPYHPAFDRKAQVMELAPGDVISWPQNSPHRVSNVQEINVSLSTLHETEVSDRRKLVYCANRFFNRTLNLPIRSTREDGAWSSLKRTAFRGCRRFGWVHVPSRRVYETNLQMDNKAPTGVRKLIAAAATEFSK